MPRVCLTVDPEPDPHRHLTKPTQKYIIVKVAVEASCNGQKSPETDAKIERYPERGGAESIGIHPRP